VNAARGGSGVGAAGAALLFSGSAGPGETQATAIIDNTDKTKAPAARAGLTLVVSMA
jgi:hypothetical protein